MPEGAVRDRLALILKRLSSRCKAPEFPPHVTLVGSIVSEHEELIQKSALVAAAIQSITIRLGKIDFRDEYFQTLFVHAGPKAQLQQAYRAACRILGREAAPDFMPHLSLLYGTFPQTLKNKIIAELGGQLRVQFKVRSLCLYQTQGAVERWRQVAEFEIK
jgi:2'-5' RNA ligase